MAVKRKWLGAYMFVMSIFHQIVMLSNMKCILILWSLCLKIVMSTITF
jgi:hypothetical protein